ncbi:MAG: glycosyltransferase family 2 protein [Phycisphaeraceae bacterium]|nr:glycosyltransferase family 2 protein [Phycisphaeraceae bacterium]
MDLTIIIPTCGRPAKLAACCAAIARQTLPPELIEVLIGIDGPDEGETEAVRRVLPRAKVLPGVHTGPAATRNRLLREARAPVVLLLNDDVEPSPRCAEIHLRAHRELGRRAALILGDAPWKVLQPDRLFDRLIRETSMIFFYDQMTGAAAADPSHDWGFRHAWTLNLSAPTDLARAEGGFNEALGRACYEDLEWAWRRRQIADAPVLFRPEAVVVHDHRYEPQAYLDRERTMGREALRLAQVSPECAREVFGRDVASPKEIEYARAFVERERRAAETMEREFLELAALPADALAPPHDDRLLKMIYQQHLLLKRWYWRRGLAEAAA